VEAALCLLPEPGNQPKGQGREFGPDELAGMLLILQRRGCHSVNQA